MTVSTIVAVRNGERYLGEAIDSVLNEGVDELIVVDDGSTDGTASILDAYGDRIITVRQEPCGQATALNRGVGLATGDVLAFQDADDIWVAGRQRLLLSALTPEVDAVFGAVEQFASPDLTAEELAGLRIDDTPQVGQLVVCMLVRRTAFDAVGPFDEGLQSAHNVDWVSRARHRALRFAAVPDTVLRRRIHATNYGRTRAAENRVDLTRVMRAHLDRQRSK